MLAQDQLPVHNPSTALALGKTSHLKSKTVGTGRRKFHACAYSNAIKTVAMQVITSPYKPPLQTAVNKNPTGKKVLVLTYHGS
jgi:hypothetical protein